MSSKPLGLRITDDAGDTLDVKVDECRIILTSRAGLEAVAIYLDHDDAAALASMLKSWSE